jgi:murein DD-endopeptidase MepM/ murein hydrolase activator NlpD
MMLLTTLLLALQVPAPAPASLPLPGNRPAVTVTPARPLQGSFILVRARPAAGDTSLTGITAKLAGEPLHFTRDTTGTFSAYAAVPVEARGAVPLPLLFERVGGVLDTLLVQVPVVNARFGSEHLSVNPRFTNPPDSALAARISRESEAIRLAWATTHETPRLWEGAFQRPRPGRVTSVFGTAREFNGVVQNRHLGTDFDGAVGATIRASNRGVVTLVGDHYYSGNIVVLNHGAGIATAYLHMSKVLVSVGDTVPKGHLIGLVGSTGRVTGPHLHWIAKYGNLSVNPLSLLSITAPPKKPIAPRPRPPRPPTTPATSSSP